MEGWQSQSCKLTGDNTTTSRGGREQDATRGRGGGGGGGQAGGCEAEVPQEATWQPAKANDWRMGGGVAGAT